MKTPFKVVGASVLALSIAFCGCSKRSRFDPMVREDAEFAVGVKLDRKQALGVLDAYVDQVLDLLACDGREVSEIKEKIAACKEDLSQCASGNVRTFFDESGLRDAELHWAVLSMDNVRFERPTELDGGEAASGGLRLDGLSLAVAGKIDLKKLVPALEGLFSRFGGGVVFTETTVEGEKAWRLEPKGDTDRLNMPAEIDPYVTSLDGELLLVAMSRNVLEKQILLYRKKKGKGKALSGFADAEGELMRLHVSDIGGIMRKNLSRSEIRRVGDFVLHGDKILLGLKDLDVDVKVSSDGKLSESFRLGTASEKDADSLRTQAKMKLLTVMDQMDKDPAKAARCWKKMVEDIQIGGADGQVEVKSSSCTAMAAALLFKPALVDMRASPMADGGSRLIRGIHQANKDRTVEGGAVWPRTEDGKGRSPQGDGKGVVVDRACRSAADYFNALFDMKHYGTPDWRPEVLDLDVGVLGKDALDGKTIRAARLDWCIAANVTDEIPDFMPVLISANFNPALLLNTWDAKTNGSMKLPIGPESGAVKSMFNDEAVVVVRKSGAAEVIQKKHLTYDGLYKKNAFIFPDMNPPIKWLTPTGVVTPVGHR